MTRPPDHRLTRKCRAVLRGESVNSAPLAGHVESCSFCAEWLRRRGALQRLLRQPPAALPESESASLLTDVRERIVEQCENGPVGRALEQVMPVAPPAGSVGGWPEPLLESELSESFAASSPESPASRVWSAVRCAVLEDIATSTSRRVRYRALLGVGVAAALVLSVMLLREREVDAEIPSIDIVDVSSLPDGYLPWAVLRNGGGD